MKKWISIISFLFAALIVLADPNTELLKQLEGNTKFADANEITIYDSTTVDVQESGLSYVNIHKLIKICNNNGAKRNSVITFGYDPLSAYVEINW